MNKLFGSVAVAVLVLGFASVGNAGGLVINTANVSATVVNPTSAGLVIKTPSIVAPVVVAPAAAPKAPAVLAPVQVAPPILGGAAAKVTAPPPILVIRR